LSESFRPYFVVKETHSESELKRKYVTKGVIEDMVVRGNFVLELTVHVSSKSAETEVSLVFEKDQLKTDVFPISGFPRRLQDDYEGNVKNSHVKNTYG
jgi:hypothetical protein